MFGIEKVFAQIETVLIQIIELRKWIDHTYAHRFSEVDDRIDYLEKIELRVDKKLVEFQKEIADKYFEQMNAFLRWNKEIALVSCMNGKDPNINGLKRELMKPYLDEKFAVNKAAEAEKINQILKTQGEQIRENRENLYRDFLKAEREGKDPVLTQTLKAKLDTLDEIIKGN